MSGFVLVLTIIGALTVSVKIMQVIDRIEKKR